MFPPPSMIDAPAPIGYKHVSKDVFKSQDRIPMPQGILFSPF